MERRKFILAIGGIASTGAAVGSGAFTSVEATRDVSVSVADDASAYLAMEPLDSPNRNQFASTDGDSIEGEANNVTLAPNETVTVGLALDTRGKAAGTRLDADEFSIEAKIADPEEAPAEGVNFDTVTQIGSHENPEDDHAFKIVNQGTQGVMLKMSYYFTDPSWLDGGKGQSFINFTLYDTGDAPTGSSSQDFPIQNGYNKDYPLAQPTGSGFGPKNTEDYAFNVGEEYYMVVTVDTTGPDASPDDDLSGIAEFFAGQETNGYGYDRTDPPI